jgi:hypothetical protein
MKLFKAAAMALVAGAGLALVAGQALAQDSSSTNTSSINGNTESGSISAGLSDTQIDATHTEGTAIAAAIATPLGTASAGGSLAGGGGGFHFTGPESQNFTTGQLGSCGVNGCVPNINPTYGSVLDGGSGGGGFHVDNGESDTFALNHIALWINASGSSTQGAATTSGTTSTGVSVAGLFVFGQTIAVPSSGSLTDGNAIGPVVLVSSGDFNGDTGDVAFNQTAGVGNQQGNTLTTLTELAAGANSINVENSQTIADAGVIGDSYTTGANASIQTNAFQAITGVVGVNQAAGVANQQVNTITAAH